MTVGFCMSRPPLTIRPTVRRSNGQRWIAVALWSAFTLVNLVRYDGWALVVMAGLITVVIAAFVLLSGRWVRGASLTADQGALTYRGLFGTHKLPSGTAIRVVIVTLTGRSAAGQHRRWVVLNEHDEATFSIDTTAWDEQDLRTIADALRLPVNNEPQPRKPGEARRLYPRSVPWWLSHPVLLTAVLIGVPSVLLTIAYAITGVAVD
jgi:hypothetical protein